MNEGKFIKLRKNLQLLDCPLLGNSEDWWMKDILITTEQYKREILIYLLAKLDENLKNVFKEEIKSSFTEAMKTKMIINTLSSLGLHKLDDSSLFGGSPSIQQLISFWEHLTELVILHQQLNEFDSNQPKYSEQRFRNNQTFLKEIAEQNKISDLFITEVTLLPPDIGKEIKTPVSRKKIKNLKNDLENLQKNLNILLHQLSKLQNEISKTDENCEDMEEKLKFSFQYLHQNVLEFKECYNSLKPWFEKSLPELMEFGEKFPVMYKLLNNWTYFNETLTAIIHSSSNLKQSKSDLKQIINGTSVNQINELNYLLQCIIKGFKETIKL